MKVYENVVTLTKKPTKPCSKCGKNEWARNPRRDIPNPCEPYTKMYERWECGWCGARLLLSLSKEGVSNG